MTYKVLKNEFLHATYLSNSQLRELKDIIEFEIKLSELAIEDGEEKRT